jgi:hypothetical protein
MQPLPSEATMSNPCEGVPLNPWCPTNPKKPAPYPVPGSPAE